MKMKQMPKRSLFGIATCLSLAILAACGKNEESAPVVPVQPPMVGLELEGNRQASVDNAKLAYRTYAAENPRLKGYQYVGHHDSSITPDCPQGDGWSSGSALKSEGNVIVDKIPMICSTYSQAIGCYRKEDFAAHPKLAGEDGVCANPQIVPRVLPKLATGGGK
jgi:hypothetical protein